MIGQSIAHYRITAKLGEGGMGIVYRASDTKLDRDVAVKVLPPEVANEPDRLARFEREAKTLAALNHPNIAAVYGVESAALIMELVEGPTLADRLNSGPIPQDEAISIAIQIAEALEAAHEKGIVHRDLKPANIKLTPSHQVKLLDFGLAKAMETTKAIPGDPINSPTIVAASMPGVIMGTAGYMSPEQAKGHPVDRRADIWSFGVVLHEMLTGQRLFDAGTIAESIAEVLKRDIDLNTLPAQTPPRVKTLLQRCLDRNPKTRLRDIGEARIQLTNPAPSLPQIETPAKSTPKWPFAIAAAFALALPAAWFLKPQPLQPPITLTLTPPDGGAFTSAGAATVSPDGSKIILWGTDNKTGKPMLWLRQLHSDSFAPLPNTEGAAASPCFSPDSRSIAFMADSKLKRLDLDDGAVRVLAEAPGNSSRPTWSERGVILFTTREELHRIPAAGGQSVPVLTPRNGFETGSGTPVFLPGGEKFIYLRVAAQRWIMISGLDGHPQPLFENYFSGATYAESNGRGWLLYLVPGGRLMARPFDAKKGQFTGDAKLLAQPLTSGASWSASLNGVLTFRRTRERATTLRWRLRDGTPGPVVATEGNPRQPRISPDQTKLLFVAGTAGAEALYLAESGRDKPIKLPIPESELDAPLWSPDGQRIIYQVTDAAGNRQILERPLNSDTPLRTLLRSHNNVLAAALSPDGKWLAGARALAGTPHAVLFPSDGTASEGTLLYPLPANTAATATAFSPDGRWLLYQMRSSDSAYSVFVRSLPPVAGGPASTLTFQVSSDRGVKPQWRSDGKEIYYIKPENQLMAVPVLPGPDFRTGKPVPLFEAPFDRSSARSYDVNADGSRFLVVEFDPDSRAVPPITVILNWPKLLERQ